MEQKKINTEAEVSPETTENAETHGASSASEENATDDVARYDAPAPEKKSVPKKILEWLIAVIPGIALCAVIAVPSWFLGKLVPVVGSAVFAIIIGMLLAFAPRPAFFERGIKFCSKKILQTSVVFLGFNMSFIAVVKSGAASLPVIVSTIATSLIVSFLLTKLLKIPSKTGTLVGVGSSICGGSAIAATSPVIRAKDSEVATAISVIFLFNVLAAFIFPALGNALNMSNEGFGLWAGTAVNDTSSVVAAGTSWSSMHGGDDTALNIATVVKLTRTLAIIPITVVLAIYESVKAKRAVRAGNAGESGSGFSFVKVFPWFVIFFLVAAVINTWLFPAIFEETFAAEFSKGLSEAGKFMITVSMAAIGLNTNVVKLIKTGVKPILLGFICWIAIAGVSLGVQAAMGSW